VEHPRTEPIGGHGVSRPDVLSLVAEARTDASGRDAVSASALGSPHSSAVLPWQLVLRSPPASLPSLGSASPQRSAGAPRAAGASAAASPLRLAQRRHYADADMGARHEMERRERMGEEGLRERACERERAREQTMWVAKALRFRCEPDACGAYSGVYSVVGATPGRQRPASATTLSVSPPPSLLAAACAAGLDAQAAASRLAAHQTAAPGAERKPASTWRVCETAGSTDFGSRFAKRRGDPLIPAQHASKVRRSCCAPLPQRPHGHVQPSASSAD